MKVEADRNKGEKMMSVEKYVCSEKKHGGERDESCMTSYVLSTLYNNTRKHTIKFQKCMLSL